MDSIMVLKGTTNNTNTQFPYQCNSGHVTNLGGIPILQHRKVGNLSIYKAQIEIMRTDKENECWKQESG